MQNFCLFWFYMLHPVWTSVLCRFSLIYLFIFLLFAVIYVFVCLPYFLKWIYPLLNCFLSSNYSHLYLLLFCRLLPVPLPRFKRLLVGGFSFLLFWQNVYCVKSVSWVLFWLVTTFLDVCFGSFRAYFFCSWNQWVKQICACSFSFFLVRLFVFLPPRCV